MVYELLHNNRTIGADDKAIGEKIKTLYSSFCQGEIVVTDIRTAEMTKVVENTFRAVNIAFANELAKICRHDNMDVYEIIKICSRVLALVVTASVLTLGSSLAIIRLWQKSLTSL